VLTAETIFEKTSQSGLFQTKKSVWNSPNSNKTFNEMYYVKNVFTTLNT